MKDSGLRAVWMDINREIRSPGDIDAYVRWCGRNGITVSFPCVNHVVGAVTYPSDVAPRLAAYEGWDPLPELTRASRAAGIETHIWVCMANAGPPDLGKGGSPEISCKGPPPPAETHPEWFCVNWDGSHVLECRAGGGRAAERLPFVFLNPARPGARDYLAALCRELMDRYDADGIHLDYIRFDFGPPSKQAGAKEAYNPDDPMAAVRGRLEGSRRYSFDEPTLREFDRETGIGFFDSGPDLASRVAWLYSDKARLERWYAWKASRVTELVRRIKADASARGRKLSAAVFAGYPWCGLEVAQRWPEWVDGRLLDFVVPMDYGLEPGPFAETLANQFSHLKVEPKPAVPFIAGIITDSFKGLDEAAAREKLAVYEETARRRGNSGISIYSYTGAKGMLR
ncbi:MAG: family 10 glycosylhydrolase [Planctomycetota bacterium]|nr:family 10 glycosylhydrolase [Planctomycetota bacterium]